MSNLSLQSIQNARNVLRDKVLFTPVLPMHNLTTLHGNPILLKAENLQPSGSFKIRGASYAISRLSEQQRALGVVAYSTGNHAQAVALAAKLLAIPATIVMSPDASPSKVEATRGYGARIVMTEASSLARRRFAEDLAKSEGTTLIPPYDHPDVISGQGTIGLEILEQLQPAAIFVPIGGGGLISGIAAAIKHSSPSISVIGVEPAWEDDAYQSFHQGQRVTLPSTSKSIADAIRVQSLGDLTYPLIRRYVDDIITINEEAILSATLTLFEQAHLVVEPAGALALAAALTYRPTLPSSAPVVCIASGGNISLENLYHLKNAGIV